MLVLVSLLAWDCKELNRVFVPQVSGRPQYLMRFWTQLPETLNLTKNLISELLYMAELQCGYHPKPNCSQRTFLELSVVGPDSLEVAEERALIDKEAFSP